MLTTVVDGERVALVPLHSRKYPGLFAIVDVDDYPLVKDYGWCPAKCRPGNHTLYVQARINRKIVYIHKLLTSYKLTDHRNGNGLDNRRCNLRLATTAQNGANRKKSAGCTSHYKGVRWHRRDRKWIAQIYVNGRQYHLGYFDNELDAAKTYDSAAIKYFGDFAKPNTYHATL